MPRALLIGTVIVAIVYVIYYIGLAGAVESEVMMAGGRLTQIAARTSSVRWQCAAIFVFVMISCWGTWQRPDHGCYPAACSICC